MNVDLRGSRSNNVHKRAAFISFKPWYRDLNNADVDGYYNYYH